MEQARFADSVAKLLALWQLCDELAVDTGPAQLSTAAAVLPLESWYTHHFDHFDPRPGTVKFDKHCVWPMGYDGACRFMPNRRGPAYMLFSDASCAQGAADKSLCSSRCGGVRPQPGADPAPRGHETD